MWEGESSAVSSILAVRKVACVVVLQWAVVSVVSVVSAVPGVCTVLASLPQSPHQSTPCHTGTARHRAD